ncbi:putative Chromo domain protein Chp1p [Aspergillus vadensis CBS 113365]|uniref:Chromo domain protein n=1 Tax=Aspergillus vadensis (strain CBS 113365 / IMI 142717 / IBT 24658) TaxID=1448311 RepID=A0A319B026_ASPVC|nr:chromo domain protein [Aspergillus vadensis CBS 113365]PYH65425.1 chromo domain protein [Aspergillus vadensis CBS 113365]
MTRRQDESDDDISITSTAASSQASEYDVEAILAEHEFPDGKRYLVKWANYPDWRSTWEPVESFKTAETLIDWQRKKQQIADGKLEAYDVANWERKNLKHQEAKERKRRRRDLKRKRLGLPTKGPVVESSIPRSSSRVSARQQSTQAPPTYTPSIRSLPFKEQHALAKQPPVLFGSGQKPKPALAPASATLRSNNAQETAKWFSHLSTRRKHEKAKFREPDPNIDQLELVRPSDWSSKTPLHLLKSGPCHVSPSVDQNRDSVQIVTDQSVPPTEVDHSDAPAHLSSLLSDPPNQDRIKYDRRDKSGQDVPELPRRVPGPYAKFVSGRFCNPGEVPTSAKRLIATKAGQYIEVWFQHLCTLEDYEVLCYNSRSRHRTYCRGWIQGFNDTESKIYNMAQELEQGDLLAIFPGNQGTPHNVLLAYPSNSLKLESLNDGYSRKEPDTFLNLVVRDPLDALEFIERLPSRARADDRWTDTRRQELVVRDSPDYELPRSGCDGIEDVVDAPMSISSNEQGNTSTERQPKEVTIETRSESSPTPRGADSSERQLNRIGIPVKPDNLQEPLKLQSEEMSSPAKPDSSQKPLEPASAETNEESTSQVQDEPMELDDEQDEPMKNHEQHSSASASGEQHPATPAPTADLGSFFETEFGVSYETLVTVNSTGKVQRAEAFFLLFESEILQTELIILQAYLKKHNPVIYTWQQKDDWEKFARAVQVGVVLVHESWVNFNELSFFQNLVNKPINFWSVSLAKPLKYSGHRSHFQRIFPHGGAILVTEDIMLQDPKATMAILAWFADFIKKKYPGYWKIMFRPAILDWILQQSESADESARGIWPTMYRLVLECCGVPANDTPIAELSSGAHDDYLESNAISPPSLPNYGTRTEADNPHIPKGLTQDQRNADHLIEFFAGWGLVHRHRYRRLIVLTQTTPLDRWKEWQHIDIKFGSKDFMKSLGISYKYYWSKVIAAPSSSSAPSSASLTSSRPGTPSETRAPSESFTPRTPKSRTSSMSMIRDLDGASYYGRVPSGVPSYPNPYR